MRECGNFDGDLVSMALDRSTSKDSTSVVTNSKGGLEEGDLKKEEQQETDDVVL